MSSYKGLIAEIGTTRYQLPRMKANITGKDLKIIIRYLTHQNVQTLYIKGIDYYIEDEKTLEEMNVGNRDIFVGSVEELLPSLSPLNYNSISVKKNYSSPGTMISGFDDEFSLSSTSYDHPPPHVDPLSSLSFSEIIEMRRKSMSKINPQPSSDHHHHHHIKNKKIKKNKTLHYSLQNNNNNNNNSNDHPNINIHNFHNNFNNPITNDVNIGEINHNKEDEVNNKNDNDNDNNNKEEKEMMMMMVKKEDNPVSLIVEPGSIPPKPNLLHQPLSDTVKKTIKRRKLEENRELLNYFHILSIICCLLSLFVWITELIPCVFVFVVFESSIRVRHTKWSMVLLWSDIFVTLLVFCIFVALILAGAVFTMGLTIILTLFLLPYLIVLCACFVSLGFDCWD